MFLLFSETARLQKQMKKQYELDKQLAWKISDIQLQDNPYKDLAIEKLVLERKKIGVLYDGLKKRYRELSPETYDNYDGTNPWVLCRPKYASGHLYFSRVTLPINSYNVFNSFLNVSTARDMLTQYSEHCRHMRSTGDFRYTFEQAVFKKYHYHLLTRYKVNSIQIPEAGKLLLAYLFHVIDKTIEKRGLCAITLSRLDTYKRKELSDPVYHQFIQQYLDTTNYTFVLRP